jgi:serine/threonine protein phosphatase PrpC
VRLQTVSHSPVGYAVEAGILDGEEAMHHDERHLVSNLVGSSEMRIEVGSPISLNPFDTVLLATDGVFDNLHQHEIVEAIRTGSLQQAAVRLASEAAARMDEPADGQPSKPDDLTFVLYRRSRAPSS